MLNTLWFKELKEIHRKYRYHEMVGIEEFFSLNHLKTKNLL